MSRPQEQKNGPQPSLRPTRPATLVVAGLTAAALAWLAIGRFYNDMPNLPWLPPLTLLALAGLEAAAAANTKPRIERRQGTEPVNVLLVARYVVLAKASALAGALFTGLYAGLSVWLLTELGRLAHADVDLPPALAGLFGSAALMAAGLWLERACRVPPPPPGADRAGPGWLDEAETDPQEADS
jgi:hypothetical protein